MQEEQFRRWYKEPLLALVATRDHRLAAIILGCSLWEASIRTNTSCQPTPPPTGHIKFRATPKYLSEVQRELSLSSVDEASLFWHTFRNGFAHNITFNTNEKAESIESEIKHDAGRAVEYVLLAPTKHQFVCRPAELIRVILDYVSRNQSWQRINGPYEVSPQAALGLSTFVNSITAVTQSNPPQQPPSSHPVTSSNAPLSGSGGTGTP